MSSSPTESPNYGARSNIDRTTVDGFGGEWSEFDQSNLDDQEAADLFGRYFSLVDLSALPADAVVMDVGCGSGRWATFVAPHAGRIILVGAAAKALDVARSNLASHPNCEFFLAELSDLPVPDTSCDLINSLGVLHHVPDTAKAIVSVSKKLKPGGQILLYLYYRFDNRPFWFPAIWKVSDFARRMISRLPHLMRRAVTKLWSHWSNDLSVALLIYENQGLFIVPHPHWFALSSFE